MSGERSLTRLLLRNIFSNWIGFAVQAVTALFLTPFILRSLGQQMYGVWALVGSVTGYYGLLDLGFRAGLTQYLTRHLSTEDYDELNQTASTGFFLLLGLGALSLVAGLVIAVLLPRFVHLSPAAAADARVAIAIMGVGFAAQFAFFTYTAMLTALQRFDVSNAIGVTTRLLTVLAVWIALRAGYGVVALSVITTVSLFVDYGARAFAAVRLVPQLHVSHAWIRTHSAKQFLGYGIWTSIVQTGVRVISYTDALVIGMVLNAAAITPFAIAVSLISYFSDLLVPITQVFFPVFTKLDAAGDRDELQRVFVASSRLMLLVCLGTALVCAACAYDFMNLWVGPSVLEQNPWGSAAIVFYVLAVGATLSGWQRLSIQVLLGMCRVELTAGLFAAEAVCNLMLSVVLAHKIGIVGVAWGTTAPSLLFNLVIVPIVTCRAVGVDVRQYLQATLVRPLAAAAVEAAALIAIAHQLAASSSWVTLFARAALSAIVVGAVALFIGMSKAERDATAWRPLRRLTRSRRETEAVAAA
jgi:O-antigen/teichoic acid export membrane protein